MTENKKLNQKTILICLTVTLIFVLLGVFCFSYANETLDLKADELGLKEQTIYDPPFPDYNITNFENKWSNLIVSVTATLLLLIITITVAKVISKKKDQK
ncbi:MAG: hypothetical protein FWH37_04365 [Candidatus Bathyarchaeota archaeon]|nr:hypothetical protein [Candidatus Termiticorpusculum sp.]